MGHIPKKEMKSCYCYKKGRRGISKCSGGKYMKKCPPMKTPKKYNVFSRLVKRAKKVIA